MKKSLPSRKLIVLFALTVSLLTSYAQTGKYHYPDSRAKSGLHLKAQKSSSMDLVYSITDFEVKEKQINGQSMHEIIFPAQILPNASGAPNIPGNGYLLAIPNGSSTSVEIVSMREEIIENVDMEPAPEIPWDTDDQPLRQLKNQTIYSQNAFYPATPVQLSAKASLRGIEVVRLGITPYQYNPATRQLKVLRDIEIRVITEGGDGTYGTDRLRSRWWDPIIKNSVLNSEVIPALDYSKRTKSNYREGEYEYLIISPNDQEFVSWSDSIRRFRNMQGIHTGVVTMGEINAVNAIALESYINTIYATWETPPAAVLLLGDYGTNLNNSIISPIWDNYCASDNILSDIDNDHLPDIVFARITAQNAEQLEVMINKFIHYETSPPTNPDFYNHPITALGWQTERWFQICSETVGGFWKNELGKEPVRINEVYEGNPSVDPWSYAPNTESVMDYFGPDGLGYITETPGELGDWWGGNANDINQAINQGAFMLQHRDHGGESGWGEPAYNKNSISGLTNTDLTFVFSINCLTGKYNSGSEVFTEKFHRYTFNGEASGALGLIAASEVSYSFVNDAFVWGLYDYMWPEFMPDYGGNFPETHGVLPAFANVYGKIFLDYTGWPYNTNNKVVTYNLFHHHGDAFLNVYTEVPQDLTVSYDPVILSGVPTFEITADAGSLICLSADGQILAVAEGTGEPQEMAVDFILPGTMVDLVVTKQNYYRYHDQLLCVPPSGPYLINTQSNILNQNGNGFICFSENGSLSAALKNVGTEVAANVVVELTCEDSFILFTDATEAYGAIEAGAELLIENGFAFTVADNVPDQHEVIFVLTATSDESTWNSEVTLTLNAPALKQQTFRLIEVLGNANGIVDAGETYALHFDVINQGHTATPELASMLATESEWVQLLSETQNTETLLVDSVFSSYFVFEVSGNTPLGHEIIFVNNNQSGLYGISDSVFVKVGVMVEDWETGDLLKFEWVNDPNNPWEIDQVIKQEGNFSLGSADVAPSQMSVLTLAYQNYSADSISFYRKTATFEGQGMLVFLLDGQEKNRWSGETDWEKVTYPLSAGKHTFIWMFLKYGDSDGLADRVWVDNIVLPQLEYATVWAGFDREVCDAQHVQLNGTATNFETLVWTTSGSGVFDDPQQLETLYAPSDEDFSSGEFTLTLTSTGLSGQQLYDQVVCNVLPVPQPASFSMEFDTVYTVATPSTDLVGETSEYATDYLWTLSPELAGEIVFSAQNATVNWNPVFSGQATIGYQGVNDCAAGELSEKTVIVSNATSVEERPMLLNFEVFPNPNTGRFTIRLSLAESTDIQLYMLDMAGRRIWKKELNSITQTNLAYPAEKLQPGVYQLFLLSDELKTVRKIVVQ